MNKTVIPVKYALATNMTINILNTINITFEQVFKLQPNIYSRSLFLEDPSESLAFPRVPSFFCCGMPRTSFLCIPEAIESIHFLTLLPFLFSRAFSSFSSFLLFLLFNTGTATSSFLSSSSVSSIFSSFDSV